MALGLASCLQPPSEHHPKHDAYCLSELEHSMPRLETSSTFGKSRLAARGLHVLQLGIDPTHEVHMIPQSCAKGFPLSLKIISSQQIADISVPNGPNGFRDQSAPP